MHGQTRDLFDETPAPDVRGYLAAFDAWLTSQKRHGALREHSSVTVYRSMWGAMAVWCVERGLSLDFLQEDHFDAYIQSRGGIDALTPRHAWRLLTLANAVLAHRADQAALPRNTAAHRLLLARPDWRYANAADKTPLPEHLSPIDAHRLMAWLLNPSTDVRKAIVPVQAWQSQRNRAAVALQLGAGLTPGDIRAATVDGVLTRAQPIAVAGSAAADTVADVAADSGDSGDSSDSGEDGGGSRTSDATLAALPWMIRLPARGATMAHQAPIAPWAGKLLRTWLDTRSAAGIGGPILFPSTRSGRCWGKVSQYETAKTVLVAAGLPDNDGGSFRLRHTFALGQLRRGTPPEQVAQWLGLSDSTALARYQRMLTDLVVED